MELNGPANIKMILQSMQMDIDECGHITHGNIKKYLKQLNNEVDLTIKYMKEVAKHIETLSDVASCSHMDYEQNVHKIPYWHELKNDND